MMTPNLSWILLIPTIGLAVLFLIPADKRVLLRQVSIAATLLPLLLSVWVCAAYDRTAGGYQFVQKTPWVEAFGISYHVGVDGINSLLLLLVGLGSFAGVLVSSSVKGRIKEYYILFLLVVIGTYAAFLSLDIFFFFSRFIKNFLCI